MSHAHLRITEVSIGEVVGAVIASCFGVLMLSNIPGVLHSVIPGYSVIANLNLGIHEAGHMLLGVFGLLGVGDGTGRFLTVLGGSLTEWSVPACCILYFAFKRRWFAASFLCLWLATTLHDSSIYIADARDLQLPLFGGLDAGAHDWNFLLDRFGVLYADDHIGMIFERVGDGFVWIAMIGTWLFALLPAFQLRSRR